MKKYRYISFLSFCFFIVFLNINVHADLKKDCKEVNLDKIWAVKFNKNIDFNKINLAGIELRDSNGTLINCNILKGDNSNEIKVPPPEDGYKFNEEYTLTITKKLYPQLQGESCVNFIIPNKDFLKEPLWNDNLILFFNDITYTVTNKTTRDIDSEIYIAAYNGPIGNTYRLYSIKGIGDYSKIAIKTKNGYQIAIALSKPK